MSALRLTFLQARQAEKDANVISSGEDSDGKKIEQENIFLEEREKGGPKYKGEQAAMIDRALIVNEEQEIKSTTLVVVSERGKWSLQVLKITCDE